MKEHTFYPLGAPGGQKQNYSPQKNLMTFTSEFQSRSDARFAEWLWVT